MAVLFHLIKNGSGTFNSELWVDLGIIPNGKAILFGYATYVAEDKDLRFELRTNLATKSAGTVVDTVLQDWVAISSGTSVDRDFFQNGFINTLSVVSTGVEHFWIRIKANSASLGAYDYIIRYTTQ